MAAEPCERCGRVHLRSVSVAEGRFNHGAPTGYRAFGDKDMPLRATREEADADGCDEWARMRGAT